MLILTVRSPSNEPREYIVKPGKTTVGRKLDNDIVIADESASRLHAEIYCQADIAVIVDMGSRNGTFVNRERLTQPHALRPEDQIRIGQHVVSIAFRDDRTAADLIAALARTQPLTRELLLESVDQHAVLLYEVASRLNTILDLKTALQEVSNLMRVSMGAEKCEVVLADRFDQLAELGFPTSIAQQAIEQHSVVVTPDVSSQADQILGQSARLLGIRTMLCVPVMIGEEVAALIYVYKTDPASRPFDQHDVQLAVAISHQAALTIQRTHLLEKAQLLEQWAITDSLTGLHNRRHFLELAELEFHRARRYQHPLSAMMLDIDHFKRVNDTYSHALGDQVIQAVAALCRENLRDIDLMGRYGGDEFVALVPEVNLDDARKAAERLRKIIADAPIDTERGPLNITISIGVVALAPDYLDFASLLNQADAALYTAKNAGRNRVEASS
ncbi:MAG TPA: diguanylate cyclase [Anaerolineales bacterium]|nr:diguanylate cyclase [Anaerolineales bacterium]